MGRRYEGDTEAAFGGRRAIVYCRGSARGRSRVIRALERLKLGLLLADHAEEAVDLCFLLRLELLV